MQHLVQECCTGSVGSGDEDVQTRVSGGFRECIPFSIRLLRSRPTGEQNSWTVFPVRLVILQPFYLPYSGVFELLRLADVFVYYDDVQFVPQNWQVRNRIKVAGGTQWLTVPVLRRHGQLINQAKLVVTSNWRRKHRNAIELAYAKAPHSTLLAPVVEQLFGREWENLVDLNVSAFELLADSLGVQAEFRRSSDLALPGRGSDRVLAYCRELGATHYLSGPSARDYLDEPSFAEAGIELEYHRFDHPVYSQLHGPFIPGLSVIDLLANEGTAAGEILNGCGSAIPARDWPQDDRITAI